MEFKQCLEERFSCRDFIDYELDNEELIKIVELAKLSPSTANMQPAKIAFFKGNSLIKLSNELLNAAKTNYPKNNDIKFYPKTILEPYKSRRFETGAKLYEVLKISKDDKTKRLEQWYKNYSFFGAKNFAILYIDENLAEGSLVDAGIFLANFVNAAKNLGYDTCILGSITDYCDIIKSNGVNGIIICGIAIGKKSNNEVNDFRTSRIENKDIIKWLC